MMTQAFAQNGAAKVYIIGRRKQVLEDAARAGSSHNNIVPLVGDVTSKESLCAVADQIRQETGYVNLVVCNSGTMVTPIGVKAGDVPVQDFALVCRQLYSTALKKFNTHTSTDLQSSQTSTAPPSM